MMSLSREKWPTYNENKLVKGYMTEPVWVECEDHKYQIEKCARHVAVFEDDTVKITKGSGYD